jgi:hypothetical protein
MTWSRDLSGGKDVQSYVRLLCKPAKLLALMAFAEEVPMRKSSLMHRVVAFRVRPV